MIVSEKGAVVEVRISETELTAWFKCPGCGGRWHRVPLTGLWYYNGDPVRPTFRPRMWRSTPWPVETCHALVTNGQIEYMDDCTHALAGQTVPLPTVNGANAKAPPATESEVA